VSRHNARLEISQRSRAYRVPQAATSTFLEGMVVLPVPLGDTALVKVPHLFVQAHVQQEGTQWSRRPLVRRHRTALRVPLGDMGPVKVPPARFGAPTGTNRQAACAEGTATPTPNVPATSNVGSGALEMFPYLVAQSRWYPQRTLPTMTIVTTRPLPHLFVQAHVQQEGTRSTRRPLVRRHRTALRVHVAMIQLQNNPSALAFAQRGSIVTLATSARTVTRANTLTWLAA
jgi:hypothetical protein